MPAPAQNSGAWKKYIRTNLSGVEEKHVDMYIAIDTAK